MGKIESIELSDKTQIGFFKAVSAAVATSAILFYMGIFASEVSHATAKNKEQDQEIKELMQIKEDIAVIKAVLQIKKK